jgi:hypothetical protein
LFDVGEHPKNERRRKRLRIAVAAYLFMNTSPVIEKTKIPFRNMRNERAKFFLRVRMKKPASVGCADI